MWVKGQVKDSTPFVSTDCFAPNCFLSADRKTLLVIYAEIILFLFLPCWRAQVLHQERVHVLPVGRVMVTCTLHVTYL